MWDSVRIPCSHSCPKVHSPKHCYFCWRESPINSIIAVSASFNRKNTNKWGKKECLWYLWYKWLMSNIFPLNFRVDISCQNHSESVLKKNTIYSYPQTLLVGGWTNPSEKYSSNGIISNKKYLKPPPSLAPRVLRFTSLWFLLGKRYLATRTQSCWISASKASEKGSDVGNQLQLMEGEEKKTNPGGFNQKKDGPKNGFKHQS